MIDELQRLLPWLAELSTVAKVVVLGGVATVTLVVALLISLSVDQPAPSEQTAQHPARGSSKERGEDE